MPLFTEARLQQLEQMVVDLQREARTSREEVQSLLKVIDMTSEEAQRTASRIDCLEHEWLQWTGDQEVETGHQPVVPPALPAGLATQQDQGPVVDGSLHPDLLDVQIPASSGLSTAW